MYQGASADGECPLVVDTSHAELRRQPLRLLDLHAGRQGQVDVGDDPERRGEGVDAAAARAAQRAGRRRRPSPPRLPPDERPGPALPRPADPGPYTQAARDDWLRRLLEAQTWIRENGPDYVRGIELITLPRSSRRSAASGSSRSTSSKTRCPGSTERRRASDFPGPTLDDVLVLRRRRPRGAARGVRRRRLHYELDARAAGRRAPVRDDDPSVRAVRGLERRLRRGFYDDAEDAIDCAPPTSRPGRSTRPDDARTRRQSSTVRLRRSSMILDESCCTTSVATEVATSSTSRHRRPRPARRPVRWAQRCRQDDAARGHPARPLRQARADAPDAATRLRGLPPTLHPPRRRRRRRRGARALPSTRSVDGGTLKFRVQRSWEPQRSGVREHLDVSPRRHRLDAPDRAMGRDRRGAHAARHRVLFFFDGEKIEALADPERAGRVIATAVESLLGLGLLERLQVDLVALERQEADSALRTPPTRERTRLAREKIARSEAELRYGPGAAAGATTSTAPRALSRKASRAFPASTAVNSSSSEASSSSAGVPCRRAGRESATSSSSIAAGSLPLRSVAPLLAQVVRAATAERSRYTTSPSSTTLADRDERCSSRRQRRCPRRRAPQLETFLEDDRADAS